MASHDRSAQHDEEASVPMLRHEKSELDVDESDTPRAVKRPARWRSFAPRISLNVPGVLLLVGLNLLCCILASWFAASRNVLALLGDKASPEAEKFEYYSPILNRAKFPFQTKQLDATLFPNASHPMAVFSQAPSKEVDRAWARVSRTMMLGLTRDDVVKLGKDPETAVKFSKSWNITGPGGEDLYLGVVDVFHQVHCLNMLRKSLITNYDYYYGKYVGFRPEVFYETHLRHCTSMLLQNIMCHSELGVFTHVWRESNPVPWPDFSINRQCRDYESLMAFRDEHDVPDSYKKFEYYNATLRDPDAVILPDEEGMHEMQASADEFRDGVYYKDLHVAGCSAT